MIWADPITIGFPFLDPVSEPAIRLTGVGLEIRRGKSYYFDNSDRNIDSFVFQYTLEGSGILEVGGQKHIVSAGKAFFINVPSDTKYYCNPEDKEWKLIFVLFMGKSMKPYYENVVSRHGCVFDLDVNSPPIVRVFELLREAREGRLNDPLSASSAAFDFMCKLCAADIPSARYSPLTQRAVDFVSENFHRTVGISDVADELGVSASHLSRSFTADTGASPIEYLTKVRVNYALRLLVSTEDSVDAIARACGFDNGNYFCKVFKKYTGTTPTSYRKLRKL